MIKVILLRQHPSVFFSDGLYAEGQGQQLTVSTAARGSCLSTFLFIFTYFFPIFFPRKVKSKFKILHQVHSLVTKVGN